MRAAVAVIEAEHGQVGALVNNAGYSQSGPVEEITPESLRRQFETNVFGVVRLCQLVLPGMRAAIDDFGIGHSSLAYLHRLPVDLVKIDQSFVAALDKPGHRGAMAGAVIALAHTLAMATIVEGVETPHHITPRQALQLRELGAGLALGFLFSRPRPAPTIAALLEHPRTGPALTSAELVAPVPSDPAR